MEWNRLTARKGRQLQEPIAIYELFIYGAKDGLSVSAAIDRPAVSVDERPGSGSGADYQTFLKHKDDNLMSSFY